MTPYTDLFYCLRQNDILQLHIIQMLMQFRLQLCEGVAASLFETLNLDNSDGALLL